MVGGSTLQSGHAIRLRAGFPSVEIGWAMALHRRIDLMAHLGAVYSSPAELGDWIAGGGGGVAARFALLEGPTALAATVRFGAIGYGEGFGNAAMLDLGSPGLELSIRLNSRLAAHAGLRVALFYVSRPAKFLGGFEGRGGFTLRVLAALSLFVDGSLGATLEDDQENANLTFALTSGLEYLFGR